MPDVHVHVGRLVLDGLDVSPAEAEAIRRAVTESLARSLQADGAHEQLAERGGRGRIEIGAPAVDARDGPTRIGHSVGRAVSRGLKR